MATELIDDVAALRLEGVPAGQPGWNVEWTVVGRADVPGLVAIVYEVIAGRRFGRGPHVVALADTSGASPALVGARVLDREQWGALIGSPVRFQDLGGADGRVIVYAPLSDGSGRLSVLRAQSGLVILFDRRVTRISDVRLEDRTADGRADVVLLGQDGGEAVHPLR